MVPPRLVPERRGDRLPETTENEEQQTNDWFSGKPGKIILSILEGANAKLPAARQQQDGAMGSLLNNNNIPQFFQTPQVFENLRHRVRCSLNALVRDERQAWQEEELIFGKADCVVSEQYRRLHANLGSPPACDCLPTSRKT
eukprot:GHVN01001111.1.p2 GENE.GHVN01001111.1~~GHVN01001111.1.p2  ORF type:complete len:142 (-),score=11.29 GHVN01001111.1:832-1257(-)